MFQCSPIIVGLACLVGMITNAGAFLGGDAAAHMAEELKNSSKILPRAMIWTIVVNGVLGFIMLVSVLNLSSCISSSTTDSRSGRSYTPLATLKRTSVQRLGIPSFRSSSPPPGPPAEHRA